MKKLNKEKLEKLLRGRLEREIADYRVGAAHLLVLQDGKQVCSICEGYRNWDTKEPLGEHTLYRLASMTKPVTAIATLIAEEKGYFSIHDLLSDHMPEFAEMYIAKEEDGQIVPGEKSKVPLRIWHLLTHCNGVTANTDIGNRMEDAIPETAYQNLESAVAYKPLEVANGAWAGVYNTLTWVSVGEQTGEPDPDKIVPDDLHPEPEPEPEPSVKVGDTFTATALMPTTANGEKGMYIYHTADGTSLADFSGYADVNGGRWWYSTDAGLMAFIDPFVDAGANYGWVGTSGTTYVAMGYKMPEAGTIEMTNWLALHMGIGCKLQIAVGTPGNVVKTYDVANVEAVQEAYSLNVAKNEMVYVIFQPMEGTPTADSCYFGYKTWYTYTAVG